MYMVDLEGRERARKLRQCESLEEGWYSTGVSTVAKAGGQLGE